MTQLPTRPGKQSESDRSNTNLSEVNARQCSSFGNALLRDYQMHLDPLNTSERTNAGDEDEKEPTSSISSASAQVNDSPLDLGPQSQSLKTSTSLLGQRKGTGATPQKVRLSGAIATISVTQACT